MLHGLMCRGVQWGKRFHFVINNGALEAEIMMTFWELNYIHEGILGIIID